jgi:ATP-binding cassette subfamily C protein
MAELWPFCRRVAAIARWRGVLALALAIVLSLSSGLAILLLMPLVQAAGVTAPAPDASGRLIGQILRIAGGRLSLAGTLVGLVALTALSGLVYRAQLRLVMAIGQDVSADARLRLFERVCRMPWADYTRCRLSDLLEILTAQIDRVAHAARSLLHLTSNAIVAACFVALALELSLPITAIMLGAGGLLAWLLMGRRRTVDQAIDEASKADKAMYAVLTESLTGLKVIRSYGAEDRHVADLGRSVARLRTSSVALAAGDADLKLWFDVGAVSILAVVAALGIQRFAIAPAALFVLLVIFVRLAPQLSAVYSQYQSVLAGLPAVAEVSNWLDRAGTSPEVAAGPIEPVTLARDVRFDRVTFSYGREVVLQDVSLTIPAGRTVAIVGPSGAGKSTLADLVLGLLTPQSGQLLVDGRPLEAGQLAAWRRQIGYVPQDTFLLHDTVRANLLWAAPGATAAELSDALTAASAGFVHDLPQGLETVVGDRGVLLSGGERQRLALARAILRRPALLVLDEATSAVDTENESRILRAIDALHGRMTILLITHRLAAVRRADVIYVLDDGHLHEWGTWDELVGRPAGRFRRLHEAQRASVSAPEPVVGPTRG